MRAPPKVRIVMSYIQRCDAIELGWQIQRSLTEKEELVKANALDYLNNYILGEFNDVGVEQSKYEVEEVGEGDGEESIQYINPIGRLLHWYKKKFKI